MPAHKFVLNARNSTWDGVGLEAASELDWTDLSNDVGLALVKWIYEDTLNLLDKESDFKLDLLRTSKRFNLPGLMALCERALLASVNVRNCIKFYTTAEDIGASGLQSYCSQLISTHWVNSIPLDSGRQLTDREKNELDPDLDLCLKKELVLDLDRAPKSDRVKDQIPIPIFFFVKNDRIAKPVQSYTGGIVLRVT